MKKGLLKFLIFLFTVIVMGILGAFYSLIFAGLAGGTALSVAPEFNLRLVGSYVCPSGAHLQIASNQNIPLGASDNSYAVNCVAKDGWVTEGMKSQAVSAVFGMYFLLCFVPTYLPGAILLWILLNRKFPSFFDTEPVETEEEEVL